MPKPVLQAMVLADHVYQDRVTGKFIIAGTFSSVWFGRVAPDPSGQTTGPVSKSGSPHLYIALVEMHGDVPLNLKFLDLSDSSVLFEGQLVLSSNDPIAVSEYAIPLPPLPTSRPGHYSLDLLYDGEILGSWRVSVSERKDLSSELGAEQ